MKSFKIWLEMRLVESARRSFWRSMSKFLPEHAEKPVAILTAFRGKLYHDWPETNNPMDPKEIRLRNRLANRKLLENIRSRGMSYYPVTGVGQELEDGIMRFIPEESFVIQPLGKMDELVFLDHVRSLLYNPAMEDTSRHPPHHQQYGAIVYLPSMDEAFLLSKEPEIASGPGDYTKIEEIGKARPTRQGDEAMTQLNKGPEATPPPGMIQPVEFPPSDADRIGRRFTVSRK